MNRGTTTSVLQSWVSIALLAYLGLAACMHVSGNSPGKPANSADPEVTFTCILKEEPKRLTVSYTIANGGDNEVGVFNRIESPQPNHPLTFPPNLVYVDREGSVVEMKKVVLPIPSGLTMTMRPVPYLTRISPHRSLTEEFSVDLPISAYNPVKRADLAGNNPTADVTASNPEPVSKVVVSIGVFKSDASVKFISVSPDYPDVYRVWPPGPPIDRQLVLSKEFVLARPVTVLDYRAVSRP